MKQVMLIRHAKSEPGAPTGKDFDRGLAPRAYSDGELMAKHVFRRVPPPERVLVSAAKRAVQTAAMIVEAIGGKPTPTISRNLYLADDDAIWDTIEEHLAEIGSLWIVGHNPGMVDAIALCTGEWVESMPTFGVAAIDFDDVVPRRGRLTAEFRPRMYR